MHSFTFQIEQLKHNHGAASRSQPPVLCLSLKMEHRGTLRLHRSPNECWSEAITISLCIFTFGNFAQFCRQDDAHDKRLDCGAEDRMMFSNRRRCILYSILVVEFCRCLFCYCCSFWHGSALYRKVIIARASKMHSRLVHFLLSFKDSLKPYIFPLSDSFQVQR